ncbi:MAG: TonB-dependent receptor [Aquabacterium sp.]|uniref:TonB-dependent receptor plug domain-containing protein n=1 Tax=Aquabacterium sp. TaxID=1872578 RepID=UPI0025B7AA4F|nr:TonB-dependent receptor [Aquabacterium sp.]MBI5925454.1 TonB-dependent receptor [Aquabacterium sp.]
MNRPCPHQAVAWAVALLCASMATAALAQTAPSRSTPDSEADRLPAVQITGTALRRIDAESALPVTVIRRAEIDRSGARTTTELLQQLPAMQGAVPTTSVVGNDSRGYASVSIHDLGDAYTLVLLNGQRVAPFGGQLSSGALPGVDINTIPLAMVDRIEVLTDGASALYGADALGGVVNIITRRDGEANEATVGWTLPKGGGREWRASALKSVGSLDEQGQSLNLAVSTMRRSALRATQRDYARQAAFNFSHAGQAYAFVADAGAMLFTAPATEYDGHYFNRRGSCPEGQYVDGDTCLYNYAADVDLIPAQVQDSLMASYTRDMGRGHRLQVDALWTRSLVTSYLAPMPALVGLTDTWALYRFVDMGRRGFEDTSSLGHLAVRQDGRVGDWNWQHGVAYSVSQQRSDISGAIGQNAAQSLMDGGVFDPLALPGAQTSAGLAALRRQAYDGNWLSGRSTLLEWQGVASKDLLPLDGGPLKWALGANVRQERLSFHPSLFAQGLLSDPAAGTLATQGDGDLRANSYVALIPSAASRLSWGVFSELLAPVSPTVDWGGAVRGDHDERAGSSWTGKTHVRWRPSPQWMWRGSLGTGLRTPTLQQLTAPGSSDGVTATSYDCTVALQTLAVQLGAQPCSLNDAAASLPLVAGGNSRLQPEKSIQATLGLRVEPIAGHSVGLDLWAVHIHDRIGVVDENVAFGNPLAVPLSTWTTVPGNGGAQLALSGSPYNLSKLMSAGLDLDATVRRGTSFGLIDSQLRTSLLLREDSQLYPGGPWFSNIGDGLYGSPSLKWRASWRTSLIRAGWTHSLTARYQSGFEDAPARVQPLDANGQPEGDPVSLRLKQPGQLLWDWQTSWRVDASWQLTAGVINLLNTKPPLSLNQGSPNKGQMIGYDERYYDARGRMLTLEARLSF